MRVAALLEVMQDAAFKLEDAAKSLLNEHRRGLLATDAAGAEGNDGLALERFIELVRCPWELPERLQIQVDGVAKRAGFHFERVTDVEQDHFAPLVQPALELSRGYGRRPLRRRVEAGHAQSDDFLLDLDQHAFEGLVGGSAYLEAQRRESGIGVDESLEAGHREFGTGNKNVDAFGAYENRALDT